ncbi:MAG: twin-arginine translocation signal domain-containing protein [Myxococcales bacterium]|nr:twin-arginine translocation signal domain-containing protein [Myxococcales bacterium]
MSDGSLSRRDFLALTASTTLLAACGRSGAECHPPDPRSLAKHIRDKRAELRYEPIAVDSKRTCGACAYYKPGTNCGGCAVMPGPVDAKGSCKLFQSG